MAQSTPHCTARKTEAQRAEGLARAMQPGQGQTISIRSGNSRPNSRSTVEGSEWGSLPSTMKGRTEPPLREDSYPLSVQTSAFHLFKCPKIFLCSHPSLPLTNINWVPCWELGQGRNGIPARASTLTDLRPQLTIHGDQGSGHAILSPQSAARVSPPGRGQAQKLFQTILPKSNAPDMIPVLPLRPPILKTDTT